MSMGKYKKFSFTLTELLVAVTVVTILTVVGLTQVDRVMDRGTDAAIKTALMRIQTEASGLRAAGRDLSNFDTNRIVIRAQTLISQHIGATAAANFLHHDNVRQVCTVTPLLDGRIWCVDHTGWAGEVHPVTQGTAVNALYCNRAASRFHCYHAAIVAPVPTARLTASPNPITSGSSTVLTWSSTGATSCVGTNFSTGAGNPTSGSVVSAALTANTTFTVTCTGAGGNIASSVTVTIVAAPTATISAAPNPGTSGQHTGLTWSSTGATSCVATAGPGFATGGAVSGNDDSTPLTTTTDFSIRCDGPGGIATASVTVIIPTPAPITATIGASPNPVSHNTATTISWSSTGVTSCTATGGPGFITGGTVIGTDTSSPLTSPATFTISCTGPAGTVTNSITVNVIPTSTLTSNLDRVYSGEIVNLTWNSTNATSCVATAGPGFVTGGAVSGNDNSGPITMDTIFTVLCVGEGGNSTSSRTITVRPPGIVISNASTGNTCRQLCHANGGRVCVSIGTDIHGENMMFATYQSGWGCVWMGGGWDGMIGCNRHIWNFAGYFSCDGRWMEWTNCRCN